MKIISLDQRIAIFIRESATPRTSEPFDPLALDLFAHQVESIPFYRAFCEARGALPGKVARFTDIPPCPTSAFKYRCAMSFSDEEAVATYHTSGITRDRPGVHSLDTLTLYEQSSVASFSLFVGEIPKSLMMLSFIPSTFERPHSSLAQMVEFLAREFSNGDIGYAFHEGNVEATRRHGPPTRRCARCA
jgi:hypothetical protein